MALFPNKTAMMGAGADKTAASGSPPSVAPAQVESVRSEAREVLDLITHALDRAEALRKLL